MLSANCITLLLSIVFSYLHIVLYCLDIRVLIICSASIMSTNYNDLISNGPNLRVVSNGELEREAITASYDSCWK